MGYPFRDHPVADSFWALRNKGIILIPGNIDPLCLVPISDLYGPVKQGCNKSPFKSSLFPIDIHFIPTPRSQACNISSRPGPRQRWKKMKLPVMTLEQHLDNPGCPAEITVDLECPPRPAGIHQIVKRITTDETIEIPVGPFSVVKTGVKTNLPGIAPANISLKTSSFECLSRRLKQRSIWITN